MPQSASGGCLLQGVSAPEGCLLWGCLLWGVCSRGCLLEGVSAPGGVCLGDVCSRGCLLQGVCASGGCVLQGVSAPRGVCSLGAVPGGGIPACTEANTLPVNRMTDRCKNITLATTSLRPVTIEFSHSELCERLS